ncbi:MAG: XRE family transcriptional regulator [Burkholderiaceae bacterium]|jgi:predicted XRE-type DNA-binding protein|nr:XRE family transcriptional regulator [Burkholderiaceae bacterium]
MSNETFTSIWDAIADTPAESVNLSMRAPLMQEIADIIRENGWKQAEAAKQLGVTQPRINDLMRGRISRFSLDALVNMAAMTGRSVRIELLAA